MAQLDLFSLHREPLAKPAPVPPSTGEELKREGVQRAAASKDSQLGAARCIAYDIATGVLPHADGVLRADRLCNADDVAAVLEAEGRPSLGNAAGSLFAEQVWEFTGARVKSQRAHAHSNELKVWRLKYA